MSSESDKLEAGDEDYNIVIKGADLNNGVPEPTTFNIPSKANNKRSHLKYVLVGADNDFILTIGGATTTMVDFYHV